jgi:hypothetical protein
MHAGANRQSARTKRPHMTTCIAYLAPTCDLVSRISGKRLSFFSLLSRPTGMVGPAGRVRTFESAWFLPRAPASGDEIVPWKTFKAIPQCLDWRAQPVVIPSLVHRRVHGRHGLPFRLRRLCTQKLQTTLNMCMAVKVGRIVATDIVFASGIGGAWTRLSLVATRRIAHPLTVSRWIRAPKQWRRCVLARRRCMPRRHTPRRRQAALAGSAVPTPVQPFRLGLCCHPAWLHSTRPVAVKLRPCDPARRPARRPTLRKGWLRGGSWLGERQPSCRPVPQGLCIHRCPLAACCCGWQAFTPGAPTLAPPPFLPPLPLLQRLPLLTPIDPP